MSAQVVHSIDLLFCALQYHNQTCSDTNVIES